MSSTHARQIRFSITRIDSGGKAETSRRCGLRGFAAAFLGFAAFTGAVDFEGFFAGLGRGFGFRGGMAVAYRFAYSRHNASISGDSS